ncbi:hypothetical protein ACFQ3C_10450 [Seohaeicola saemankumensis]|uniref:Uncharacterized protein n=1 Tax=Seohaeicola saemankumensis TaxID=481181 RepID=A0ABW3TD26_9RHOB
MDRRTVLKTGGAAVLGIAGLTGAASGAAGLNLNSNLVTVGNSLIDQSVDMVQSFRTARRGRGDLSHQTIPGAPMAWNWKNAGTANLNARDVLARGGQHIWMGVESVPFRHVQADICDINAWSDWYRLAIDNGVQRFLLFEAWHDLRSGLPDYQPEDRADPDTGILWRDRLDFALPFWTGIVDHVNKTRRPSEPEMHMIPGGQMLARIHDDIAAGRAPSSLTQIEDLFMDNIHPNIRGRYAMACIMYACIFHDDPNGLPRRTKNIWGQPYDTVAAEEAGYFQKIAWEVARANPIAGLQA